MKRNLNNMAFVAVAALFVCGIVHSFSCGHGIMRHHAASSVMDSAMGDSLQEDSFEREMVVRDSIDSVTSDSIKNRHLAEYTLMDTIISMSQTIREKTDRDYSGCYWQWLRDCNIQMGVYLRTKGIYHGRLYYTDVTAALDSVDNFVNIYLGRDDSQSGMNVTAEVKWVIDYLRTEEVYQLILHRMVDADDRQAVYRDYQNWFWTTEVLANFYYQVIEGGDQGSGSMSSMDVAYASLSFSRMHRFWLQEELKQLHGQRSLIGKDYQKINRMDFEKEKKWYIRRETSNSDGDVQRKMDAERVAYASDSLIRVFYRWMDCRDSIENTIADKKRSRLFHKSTTRIKWYMYQLWRNRMDANKVMPELSDV